ncbi:GNAT family N-acetyltransferase [Sulfobacillus harzensis]|uniref:GNAT family N-acetyltransferase n=1 Tax=Sulfobacillus harzensis TaxID=2729629 RepID=A0A7Y0Q321_9FIRM|nr:GNAT family N-acetyltransferase [Sulfobacillus harzensis]NMP23132.1 GNAT family N-acetyltransferase [Sulfobacillus harzensis]
MGQPPKNLSRGHLLFRPIDLGEDSTPWFKATQDPAMYVWTGNPVPASLVEARRVLENYQTHPDIYAWCVRDLEHDDMIGVWWIGVPYREEGTTRSFDAQRIFRRYWRTGRTQAARRIIYDYVFQELGIDEMRAAAWADNRNSCLSMEAAGFHLADERHRWNPKHGVMMREREYVLTRENWRDRPKKWVDWRLPHDV